MASYFDEHNCEPLREGQTPDHLLHLARMLQDGGFVEEFEELFGQIDSSPPASKDVIANLPDVVLKPSDDVNCAICLLEYSKIDKPKILPCDHKFHKTCIVPWLTKTNTCPVCRYLLPTDDEAYEAMRRHKDREQQRKYELDSLHDSMYG